MRNTRDIAPATQYRVDTNERQNDTDSSIRKAGAEVVKVACIAIFSSLILVIALFEISTSTWLKILSDNSYIHNSAQGFYAQVYSKNMLYYLSLILGSGLVALFSYLANLKEVHLRLVLNEKLLPFFITLLLSLVLMIFIFSDLPAWHYLYKKMLTSSLRVIYALMITVLSAAVFFQLQIKNRLFDRIYHYFLMIVFLFVASVFLRNYIEGFSDLDSSRLNNVWNGINFNAVFHSVVQANFGKMPLIDYFAQYGYYSYLLRPIFLIIPFTLTSFIAIMAVLSALCFFFLYNGLKRLINSRMIAALTTLACISWICVNSSVDCLYLANLPIRYFWPCVGFFLIVLYSQARSQILYYLIQISCVLSIIWNLDSGVVLTGASLLVLSYESIFDQSKNWMRSVICHWLISVSLMAAVLTCYALYTWCMRSEIPLYGELVRFQILFFGKGIMATPMSLLSPWVIACIVYVFALAYNANLLFSKRQKESCDKGKVVLFLALYGLGSFSYFIMRTHLHAFYAISWPAIILLGIFISYLRGNALIAKIDGYKFAYKFIYFWLVLFLITTGVGLFPRLMAPRLNINNIETSIEEQRLWVKSLNFENSSLLIISDYSGILHLASKTSSPIRLPGSTEAILRDDLKTIENYLRSTQDGGPKLIVDTTMLFYSNEIYKNIRKQIERLKIIEKSPHGHLIYYAGFAD